MSESVTRWRASNMNEPKQYSDLIGPARTIGKVLDRITGKLKNGGAEPHGRYDSKAAFLMYGLPGVGKTSLARIFANQLAGDVLAIDERSGLNVNVDTVRGWLGSLGVGNLFGDWQVRMIEELDRVPRDAQDMLLHYLDKLPPKTAFIATSNLQLDLLQERFQTRLRTWKVEAPNTAELCAFLMERKGLDRTVAASIAVGSGGNVRAAMLDADNELDAREALAA
jgi:replication-associated recombination protein RarA